ncbi:MAG TPA: PDZ domain-containing protein [Vicinamibacterales bacterium]|nr:PDZ domain-containing protein [Vicinamibacterales bacterium]
MKTAKLTILGLGLACAVGVAVSTAAAQGSGDNQVRPRVMTLDGRGAQIGVVVDDVAEGVRVAEVDQDSPASNAGLQAGDIIVEVDGERVRSARQFARLIQETAEGRSVALGVLRAGTRQTVNVTPESRGFWVGFDGDALGREIARLEPRLRELEPRLRELEPRLREFRFNGPFDFDFDALPRITSPRGRLGVRLNELTPQLAEYFGAAEGGVLVTSVTKDSPADKAGLKAGDVITTIDGERVRRTEDVIDELRNKEGDVTVGILRDKEEATLKATIEARPRVFRRPA